MPKGLLVSDFLRRHRYGVLVVLVLVAIALSGFAGFKTREYAHDQAVNAQRQADIAKDQAAAKATLAQLAKEQLASCRNYRTLRDAVNLFHGTLDGLLKTAQHAREAAYKRDHQLSDKQAVTAYKQLRRGIHLVRRDCAQSQ